MSNLKRIRESNRLSQMQLSIKTAIPVSTIQALEQRTRNINKTSVGTLIKLSNALKCDISDLLEDELTK